MVRPNASSTSKFQPSFRLSSRCLCGGDRQNHRRHRIRSRRLDPAPGAGPASPSPGPPTWPQAAPIAGVNTVSLWAAAEVSHYSSGVWGTFNQWRSLGANVRKGERSSLAVLWKDLTKSTEASDVSADEEGRLRVFARGFAVFNHDQVDGYDTTPAVILPEDQTSRCCGGFPGQSGDRGAVRCGQRLLPYRLGHGVHAAVRQLQGRPRLLRHPSARMRTRYRRQASAGPRFQR